MACRRPIVWIGWVLGLFLACMTFADGKGPLPAQLSPAEDGRLLISAQDRCPVCGMFPAKRPKSAAALVLTDGRGFYFCSNGCLLRTCRDPGSYLMVEAAQILKMVVQDYFTGKPLDGRSAWWVAGSDIVGPMGPALVALADEQAVTIFRERHGGETVFRIDQLNEGLWRRILPKRH